MLLQEPQLCKDWIPTMKLQTELFFPYPRCQSCGQMWMSVSICWRSWAPPPVRAKRSSTTSAGAEGSTKIRVLASGDFWSGILWALWIWVVFGAYFLHPRLAGNLFFPCLSALRNWVPCNFSMLILCGCKPNHGSLNLIFTNLRCSAILHWS